MAQIVTILVSLVAAFIAFYSTPWSWVVLAIPAALLAVTLVGLKQKRWKHLPELSAPANALFQKFGHYYTAPTAGRDYSAAASALMFANGTVASIGAFKGFWWGLGIALLVWVVMGLLSRAFNPSNFLVDPTERLAHEEILSFMQTRQELPLP